MPSLKTKTGWSYWQLLGAAALIVPAVVLTLKAWADIARFAIEDEESSHIWLVGIAVPWLILSSWEKLKSCMPANRWIGPLIVAIGWALHVIGYDYRYDVLWHGGSVMIVIGCLLSFAGFGVLRAFLPAFIALVFLLPIPGRVRADVGIPMQTVMAIVSEQICHVIGIGVDRAGNVLIVNDRRIEIAEACNGMRMVFGLCLVAYTFAFANPLRWWVRVLILLTMPCFALICNVIRVVPTVWLFGHAPTEVAEGFHDLAGYVMIVVAVLMLMGMLRILRWAGVPVVRAESGERRAESREREGERSEERERLVSQHETARWSFRRLFSAIAHPVSGIWHPLKPFIAPTITVLLLFGLARSVESRQPPDDVRALHDEVQEQVRMVPRLIGEWYGRSSEVPARAIKSLHPNVMISREYENLRTGESVMLLLLHCRDARHLAHHYPPICYRVNGWRQTWSEERDWAVAGQAIQGMEYGFTEDSLIDPRQIVIANAMMLPTGVFARDMDPIYTLSRDPFMRFYGAGQLQLIFDAATPSEQREAIFRTILGACMPHIIQMLEGADGD